jgi:hypothetical protein
MKLSVPVLALQEVAQNAGPRSGWDWVALAALIVGGVALIISGLSWWESRKANQISQQSLDASTKPNLRVDLSQGRSYTLGEEVVSFATARISNIGLIQVVIDSPNVEFYNKTGDYGGVSIPFIEVIHEPPIPRFPYSLPMEHAIEVRFDLEWFLNTLRREQKTYECTQFCIRFPSPTGRFFESKKENVDEYIERTRRNQQMLRHDHSAVEATSPPEEGLGGVF